MNNTDEIKYFGFFGNIKKSSSNDWENIRMVVKSKDINSAYNDICAQLFAEGFRYFIYTLKELGNE